MAAFYTRGCAISTKALRGRRQFPDKGFYEGIVYSEGGVGGPAFSAAQHAGSLGPARLLARRIDLGGAQTLLDVGGGSGAYTLAFLKQNPALQRDHPRFRRDRVDGRATSRRPA